MRSTLPTEASKLAQTRETYSEVSLKRLNEIENLRTTEWEAFPPFLLCEAPCLTFPSVSSFSAFRKRPVSAALRLFHLGRFVRIPMRGGVRKCFFVESCIFVTMR